MDEFATASSKKWTLLVEKHLVTQRASQATHCLEQAWKSLQRLIPNLPNAVLIVLSGTERKRKHGHFAWTVWRTEIPELGHEIGISPDLFGTPEDLLATLVHEAVHALLYADQAAGCGPDGYYHRVEFRDTCLAMGLACDFHNRRHGFCLTYWPSTGLPERYQPILDLLVQGLPWGTGPKRPLPSPKRTTPPSGHIRLVCQCRNEQNVRSIYVNKFVSQAGGVMCAFCKTEFRPPKKDLVT